jgi:hypothetical protein
MTSNRGNKEEDKTENKEEGKDGKREQGLDIGWMVRNKRQLPLAGRGLINYSCATSCIISLRPKNDGKGTSRKGNFCRWILGRLRSEKERDLISNFLGK